MVGLGDRCPSLTHLYFRVNSILTSNTKWPLALVQPGEAFLPISRIVNVIPTLFISFRMASVQNVFPFFWLICAACVIDVGISIPYLCEHFLTQKDTADTMTSLFRKVYGTHQAKAVSSWIPQAITYSATSTGFDSFKYLRLTHCLVPFFRLIWSAHPTVVLRCVR